MVHRPQSLWDTIEDVFTTTDDERVETARARVEREMFSTPEALAWAQSQGLNVAAQQRGPEGLRNEASRDSVLYSMINNFYSCHDNLETIRSRYREQGFDNGTTTKTYFFNMGPGTLGRGASNHEAAMVVDESQNPPIITLNFRGSNLSGSPSAWREGAAGNNIFSKIFDMGMYLFTGRMGNTPIPEWLSHLKGFMSYLTGQEVQSYDVQSEAFWRDAGPDIQRIMQEVSARHPGVAPQIIIAGHSYGVDGATRMVPHLAEAFPQWRENISLVGFGGVPSFSATEQERIYGLLGNNPERARQYGNQGDWIDPVAFVQQYIPIFNLQSMLGTTGSVGERRVMIGGNGHDYTVSSQMHAMIESIERDIARDPANADARARAIIDNYRRDPSSALSQLAQYATGNTGGSTPPNVAPRGSERGAVPVPA